MVGVTQILLISQHRGDEAAPTNLGQLVGTFVDYAVSGNTSNEFQTAFGYANDGFIFVGTGGTGGNIQGIIQAFSKDGKALVGAANLVNAGLFVNELKTIEEHQDNINNACE